LNKQSFAQTQADTAYFNKGFDFLQEQKWDSAINIFDDLLKKFPNFTVAYLNRGICYYYQNDKRKAKIDYDKTIEVAKAKFKMTMTVANMLFQLEEYEDAYQYFEQATKIKEKEAEPYFKMGRCLWLGHIPTVLEKYKGDYTQDLDYKKYLKKDILKLFDQATSLDSTTEYLYFYYKGMFYANFEDYTEALANFETSIEIHPVIQAYKYSAEISKKLKLNQKACDYINQWAMMFNPQDEMNPFQKKEYAKKFCEELGVKN
jgi:tetratricopeptide (TPR) repeat protein